MIHYSMMSLMANLAVVIVTILLWVPFSIGNGTRIASVVLEGNQFVIKEGVVKGWIATGNFTDYIEELGWSFLTIDTNGDHVDTEQAYAAGFLEGNLTGRYINMMWNNVLGDYCKPKTKTCSAVRNFLAKNSLWMINKINSFKTSIYWHQVQLILQQLMGMETAYYRRQGYVGQELSTNVFGLLLLQVKEELDDIEAIIDSNPKRDKPLGSGSCSALIKLLPNRTDLLVAHDTWSTYNSMLRVIKKYNLAYMQSPMSKHRIPGGEIAFTSYPGILHSVDDFYVTSRELVVMETTFGNFNADLWKYSTPSSLQTWIRVLVSLRLSNNAYDWVSIFRDYNMGTYNNQWMVIDYSKFTASGKTPLDGTFIVVEQLPGFIEATDFTSEIYSNNSYWASYNIPYFKDIYNMSGMQAMCKQYGNVFSYDDAPRAKIFHQNQSHVVDVDSMMRLMRYNDFQNDPLSSCNCTPPYSGENGISARSDLNPANGTYSLPMLGHRCHGGIDAKVISSSMVKDFSFLAVSGPTWDQQVPFQWSRSDFEQSYPHEGMPDLFNFSPIKVDWKT